MNQADIYTMLAGCGIPIYRDYADIADWARLPYLVYLIPQDRPIASDLEVLAWWHHVQLELYTRCMDLEAEAMVERTLRREGIAFHLSRETLPEPDLHVTTFEFDILEA